MWSVVVAGLRQGDRRSRSDGFEIDCGHRERVRVAFALDCCDREAMSWVAATRRYQR